VRASALHRPFEKISCIRRNAKPLAHVLSRVVQAIFDGASDCHWIQCQTPHSGIEEVRLLFSETADNVFDRDVILIATL
jgi:hypothetical protein